jgi:hypothetical protein
MRDLQGSLEGCDEQIHPCREVTLSALRRGNARIANHAVWSVVSKARVKELL